jgi:hypothetical protein
MFGFLPVSATSQLMRLECQPGEELQLDFGLGAPIDDAQGKTRRSWVLRMVLSYSRKAYSEAVTRPRHRDVHSLPGKRPPKSGRFDAFVEPRQHENGGAEGRLV